MIQSLILCAILLLSSEAKAAQLSSPYQIGVVYPGGAQSETLNGFRDGLKELGMEENKNYVLIIKNTKGDAKAAEEAAKTLERENVNLIYAVTSTLITVVKAATVKVPIVFAIGSDPVSAGLVNSFAQPGGRLTGVHYLARDLTAKRLEILKEIIPTVSRIITFYDPNNRVPAESAAMARKEAARTGIKLIERHVANVDEVKKKLDEIKAGEADAFFYMPDAMVGSQSQLIIDKTKAKKLPAMFQEHTMVAQGALASYGQNYRDIGRSSAKYVHRVLSGAKPQELKVETIDSVELAINLRTAQELGLKIAPNVLARANKVVK
jgi:putative ABC transport system substrate-binding protein